MGKPARAERNMAVVSAAPSKLYSETLWPISVYSIEDTAEVSNQYIGSNLHRGQCCVPDLSLAERGARNGEVTTASCHCFLPPSLHRLCT